MRKTRLSGKKDTLGRGRGKINNDNVQGWPLGMVRGGSLRALMMRAAAEGMTSMVA